MSKDTHQSKEETKEAKISCKTPKSSLSSCLGTFKRKAERERKQDQDCYDKNNGKEISELLKVAQQLGTPQIIQLKSLFEIISNQKIEGKVEVKLDEKEEMEELIDWNEHHIEIKNKKGEDEYLKKQTEHLSDFESTISSQRTQIDDLEVKNQSLQEDNLDLGFEVAFLKQKLDDQKLAVEEYKQIQEGKTRLSSLHSIFEAVNGGTISLNQESTFTLFLNCFDDFRIMIKMIENRVRIPNIKSVELINLQKDNAELDRMLTCCMPKKLGNLEIRPSEFELVQCGGIINGLSACLPNVTNEIFLHSLDISPSHLERIFKRGRNSEKLIFSHCRIETLHDMDFEATEYKTKLLSFTHCGSDESVNMNWKENPSRFGDIMEAISKCPMKECQKDPENPLVINIFETGLTIPIASEIASSFNLNNVEIVNQADYEFFDYCISDALPMINL